MTKFQLSGLSSAVMMSLAMMATHTFAASPTQAIWDAETVPDSAINAEFSAAEHASDYVPLKVKSNAKGTIENLTVTTKAVGPKDGTSQDKEIYIYVAGGETNFAGEKTAISMTTDFVGGGNNSIAGMLAYGGTTTISSKTTDINVSTTRANGKAAYGLVARYEGSKLNLTGDTVNINVSTATDRPANDYSETFGINVADNGTITSAAGTTLNIAMTSTGQTKAAESQHSSCKGNLAGASSVYGVMMQGGKADLQGRVVVNATAEGGNAVGIGSTNFYANTTSGTNFKDSTVTLGESDITVSSKLGKAVGLQTFYRSQSDATDYKVVLSTTGPTAVSAKTVDGEAVGIEVSGKTNVRLGGNVNVEVAASGTGSAKALQNDGGAVVFEGQRNHLVGDVHLTNDAFLAFKNGQTAINGKFMSEGGEVILDKAVLALYDDARLGTVKFGMPVNTFAMAAETVPQQAEIRILGGTTEFLNGVTGEKGAVTVSETAQLKMGGQSELETLNAEGDVTLNDGASLRLTGDSNVRNLSGESAELTLETGKQLAVGGAVNVGTMSGTDSTILITTDKASVHMTTDQTKSLSLGATGNVTDALDGNVDALLGKVTVGSGEQSAPKIDNVKMQAGAIVGEVTKVGDGPVVEHKNEANVAKLHRAASMPALMTRIQLNELRKRMGDIRSSEGQTGVWARYNGGKMQGDYKLDADFNMIQVGADTVLADGLPRLGATFSYAKTEADDNYGSADLDTYTLAGYGIWTWQNGAFADVIARAAKADTDMTEAGEKGSLDSWLFSVSGEIGQRATFAETFYVEPSAEFTYTWMEGDTFNMGDVKRTIGDAESLIGRFGLALGKSCPSGFGDFYVRAGLVHEFMGNTSVTSTRGTVSRTIVEDGSDTWVEYAVGGNINFNKNTYLYVDLERTEGASLEEDWRANLGVRYSF